MPFSTIANRQASHYDALAVVRQISAAAIAATTSEPAILFPITKHENFAMVLEVQAFTGTVGPANNWAFAVEASTAVNGTFVNVGSITLGSGAANHYIVALSGHGIDQVVPNSSYVRVTATKTGTVGNLIYAAFLSPNK